MKATAWFYGQSFNRGTRTVEAPTFGRKYVDGCKTCEEVKANGGFGPSHDAKIACESNRREHCTCDTCF